MPVSGGSAQVRRRRRQPRRSPRLATRGQRRQRGETGLRTVRQQAGDPCTIRRDCRGDDTERNETGKSEQRKSENSDHLTHSSEPRERLTEPDYEQLCDEPVPWSRCKPFMFLLRSSCQALIFGLRSSKGTRSTRMGSP